jgi:hypothetical protein
MQLLILGMVYKSDPKLEQSRSNAQVKVSIDQLHLESTHLKKTKRSNKVAANQRTHFEHVQIINCDFKPGSVERSIHHWSFQSF